MCVCVTLCLQPQSCCWNDHFLFFLCCVANIPSSLLPCALFGAIFFFCCSSPLPTPITHFDWRIREQQQRVYPSAQVHPAFGEDCSSGATRSATQEGPLLYCQECKKVACAFLLLRKWKLCCDNLVIHSILNVFSAFSSGWLYDQYPCNGLDWFLSYCK